MFKRSDAHLLVPALILLAGGLAIPLKAQGATGWMPVHFGHGKHAHIRALLVQGQDGYQLFFKDTGTQTVHFNFFVQGIQTVEAVSTNGRIHLKPSNLIGPLFIHAQQGATGGIKIQASEVSFGDTDVPNASDATQE